MPDYCLETTQLTHYFPGKEKALDNICLQVPTGAIYGFLGPNGAGKTTTLKLVLGLLKKQEGTIRILGESFDQHRVAILKRVGSLIESPSIYGHLTAAENLWLLQKIYQCPARRVNEVLELTALAGTGSKKAGRFSLGMKQRLSIAIAMLHNPSLLILDEPTNGLDPGGIIEMRALLRQLNQESNMTILISSHMLSEIEKLVTHVGIINKGKLLYQGVLSDLTAERTLHSRVQIDCSDLARSLTLIAACGLHASVEQDKILLEGVSREQLAVINQRLVMEGVQVYEMNTRRNDLEDIFMHLTNN
ncbi:ATP-binding cassette domain-containing protein [Chitinophaga sp. RAB17]|uniref:ATP-binding cassette domain-containing protein n=1 Tax=Chitinophaga sp. RAB17 TaxID=3233049 RepID=UPI003F8F5979